MATLQQVFDMLGQFHSYNLKNMEPIFQKVLAALDEQYLGLAPAVAEILADLLDSRVTPLSIDAYQALQDFAKKTPGRCCGSDANRWWVTVEDAGKIHGSGAMGLGILGRAGRCPIINVASGCIESSGLKRGVVSTHFETAENCFPGPHEPEELQKLPLATEC